MKILLVGALLLFIQMATAQNRFNNVYPIGDDPSIGYKTRMVSQEEKMIFEANPILRMPFLNNIQPKLINGDSTAHTLYLHFKPQIRMYNANSKPVKTPSYNIGLAYQHLYRLSTKNKYKGKFLVYSFETGHYSNGQAKSAFSKHLDDGSEEAKAIYREIQKTTDLSAILNRESGDFSTNFTELHVKYIQSVGELNDNNQPVSSFAFEFGYNLYHNNLLYLFDIGGYSEEDIKIYGRHRFKIEAEYMRSFREDTYIQEKFNLDRYTFTLRNQIIAKPHASVNPLRFETKAAVWFNNNVGLFVSWITGQIGRAHV